ncbi:MAG: hypothetical protein MZV64_17925 [Ignavibacteriales bacterium]|nr:hypothetical protein [Ignavibacteriales bacterium]
MARKQLPGFLVLGRKKSLSTSVSKYRMAQECQRGCAGIGRRHRAIQEGTRRPRASGEEKLSPISRTGGQCRERNDRGHRRAEENRRVCEPVRRRPGALLPGENRRRDHRTASLRRTVKSTSSLRVAPS